MDGFLTLKRGRIHGLGLVVTAAALTGSFICGCARKNTIAVIPQTDGIPLWDAAHSGVDAAASRAGVRIYWNAPTRADDIEAQISLVEYAMNSGEQGLILAPDQCLALISPVRDALSHGIPTVIIGSPLPLPENNNLSYVVNDDQLAGQIAARRLAMLLHDRGRVVLLGLDPDLSGVMLRAQSFQSYIAQNYPKIHIVDIRKGSFNIPREQQVGEEVLRSHPDLDAVVALMWSSTDATLSALDILPGYERVKVIGFDAATLPPLAQNTHLDSVIQEDTRTMGKLAIEQVRAMQLRRSKPISIRLRPILITRDNLHSAQVAELFAVESDFRNWRWSSIH